MTCLKPHCYFDLTVAFMWYSGYIFGMSGFFFYDLDSLVVGALKRSLRRSVPPRLSNPNSV